MYPDLLLITNQSVIVFRTFLAVCEVFPGNYTASVTSPTEQYVTIMWKLAHFFWLAVFAGMDVR